MASTQAQTALATVSSSIPTVESVRTSPAVIAESPVLATVPKTKLIPRPAGTPNYPQLSTAIYTERERGAGRLGLTVGGDVGGPIGRQHGAVQFRRRPVTGSPMPGASRSHVTPAGPGRPSVLRRSHEPA